MNFKIKYMYYKYNNRPHTVHMPDKMNYDDADGGDDDDKKPNQLIQTLKLHI